MKNRSLGRRRMEEKDYSPLAHEVNVSLGGTRRVRRPSS